jgi:hypothetical protein
MVKLATALENLHCLAALVADPTGQTLALTNAGQEYLIDLTMQAYGLAQLQNFTFANGLLTFTGTSAEITFNGDTVIQSDKAANITLTTYLNAVPVSTTPYSYHTINEKGNFSSNSAVTLVNGDVIKIVAESDVANTTLTFVQAKVTYDGYETT